jgi:hypothetical protein
MLPWGCFHSKQCAVLLMLKILCCCIRSCVDAEDLVLMLLILGAVSWLINVSSPRFLGVELMSLHRLYCCSYGTSCCLLCGVT